VNNSPEDLSAFEKSLKLLKPTCEKDGSKKAIQNILFSANINFHSVEVKHCKRTLTSTVKN